MEINLRINFDTDAKGDVAFAHNFRVITGRHRQSAKESELFGDAEIALSAALERSLPPVALDTICKTLSVLAKERAAGQKRAALAIRDAIGLHVATDESALFYQAVAHIVHASGGVWTGDANELSDALGMRGLRMRPRAAARMIWLEEGALTLGGYRVVREVEKGHFRYYIHADTTAADKEEASENEQ
jgi:hypothetical protein